MPSEKPIGITARQMIQKGMTITREKIINIEFDESIYDIVEVNVEIKDLDPVFHDYKIVNLSDLHLGQWLTAEYLEGVIDIVNRQEPDMVALTGDYVSYVLEDVADDLERCLSMIEVKDSSFAVLGNHDHWNGADEIRQILKNAGIIDVSNDVHSISRDTENGTAYLHIAGVDSMKLNKEDIDAVMLKIPEQDPAIMLAHEPDFADIAATTGRFALQISGHSHGGQFIIPGLNTTILRSDCCRKYPVGEYQVGDMVQYTSKGLGTNVFWLRINCAPEITIFNLKSPEIEAKIENKENENINQTLSVYHSKRTLPTRDDIDNFLNIDDISAFIESKRKRIPDYMENKTDIIKENITDIPRYMENKTDSIKENITDIPKYIENKTGNIKENITDIPKYIENKTDVIKTNLNIKPKKEDDE